MKWLAHNNKIMTSLVLGPHSKAAEHIHSILPPRLKIHSTPSINRVSWSRRIQVCVWNLLVNIRMISHLTGFFSYFNWYLIVINKYSLWVKPHLCKTAHCCFWIILNPANKLNQSHNLFGKGKYIGSHKLKKKKMKYSCRLRKNNAWIYKQIRYKQHQSHAWDDQCDKWRPGNFCSSEPHFNFRRWDHWDRYLEPFSFTS